MNPCGCAAAFVCVWCKCSFLRVFGYSVWFVRVNALGVQYLCAHVHKTGEQPAEYIAEITCVLAAGVQTFQDIGWQGTTCNSSGLEHH